MEATNNSVWQPGGEVFVIAEIGLNHNGSLEIALDLIDVAAEAGAQAVKFQKRDVDSLAVGATLDSPDLRFPSLGRTYRELREKHEFSEQEFHLLSERAAKHSLVFFATPFDSKSLEFLEKMDVDRYKVASHSVTNLYLLEEIAQTEKPVLLSTGMANIAEVDAAVGILNSGSRDLALLHCVSSYPTDYSETRLDLIPFYSARYGLPIGYSGHEIGYEPTLYAVAAGARIVERHITLSNEMEGFDHRLSLNPESFSEMVSQIRSIEEMFPGGPKVVTDNEKITRDKYQVSMVSRIPLTKGSILGAEDVVFKNPGTGIPPAQMGSLLGKRARDDIGADTILTEEMFR